MANDNIDLNSPDATKVRGSSAATTRSGKVDSFISQAKAHFSQDVAMGHDLDERSIRTNKVLRTFAGKQLHAEHAATERSSDIKTPVKGKPVKPKKVDKKSSNGQSTTRANIYDDFKKAHNQATKADDMENEGPNPQ